MFEFDEQRLDALRGELSSLMSPKRYAHTLGVERMAVRLGQLFCPEKIPQLRAAALLHDITKEESLETDGFVEIKREKKVDSVTYYSINPIINNCLRYSLQHLDKYKHRAKDILRFAINYNKRIANEIL